MDQERWGRFTYKEQIGNIASELRRAMVWEKKQDEVNRDRALERALDLVSMSVMTARKTRRREMARFKETICHCLVHSREYDITLADLEHYCLAHFS